ncbi:MAG: YjaA family stress response protein [Serratia sp. (in: enterobacteria)]|uniref:YjaA family stress response protein n=1 Tax=Serratia sp. (in: enterobacteria) TaxID=616 RepID=UPI003F307F38
MSLFYLQVRSNHLTLKSLETQKTASRIGPFSTQRLLIGQFFIAEYCLLNLVPEVFPGYLNLLKRRHLRTDILVHAMDKLEGGVSQVEQRVLEEFVVPSFRKGYSTVYADPQPLDDETVRRIIQMNSREVITAADLKLI